MTPPPQRSPEPDYAEKRGAPWRKKTGEWSMDDVVHALKQRKTRRWKEIGLGIAAIITALGGATAAIIKARGTEKAVEQHQVTSEDHEQRLEVNDYRLDQVEKKAAETADKVDACRLDVARCCHRKGGDL